MSVEQNRELLRRRLEMWNSGNLDIAEEIFSPDFLVHDPEGDQRGLEPFKELYSRMRAAFPDLEMRYEQAVCNDEKLAYVWRISGTHRGPMRDIDPTGDEVSFTGSVLARVEDGKIVEEWRQVDMMGLLGQLGLPVPRAASAQILTAGETGSQMPLS